MPSSEWIPIKVLVITDFKLMGFRGSLVFWPTSVHRPPRLRSSCSPRPRRSSAWWSRTRRSLVRAPSIRLGVSRRFWISTRSRCRRWTTIWDSDPVHSHSKTPRLNSHPSPEKSTSRIKWRGIGQRVDAWGRTANKWRCFRSISSRIQPGQMRWRGRLPRILAWHVIRSPNGIGTWERRLAFQHQDWVRGKPDLEKVDSLDYLQFQSLKILIFF